MIPVPGLTKAGGSGGTTDHAALSNLSWNVSGHVGAINSFPHFDGSNAPDVLGETGTGNVVRATSPTIVTPVIVSFATAQHNHEDAAGGGQLGTNALSDNAVTNAKAANMAAQSVKANPTGSSADPQDLTVAEQTLVGRITGGNVDDLSVATVQNLLKVRTIPGGRLTLVTATPVMTTEQAAKTTIYYAIYNSDLVPIYDGTNWAMTTFTELSLALDSDSGHTGYHQSGKNFDLFVYNDAGTLRLLSGPAWTNDTTRATAIERVNGIWMNAASMTGRFGSAVGNTVTVAQDRGTYVGTFRASANGTTTWELGGTAAGGDPGLLYLWNTYNRIDNDVFIGEATDSWTYNSNTWRSFNNSTNNRVSFVIGLDEDPVEAIISFLGSNGTGSVNAGMCLDATNTFTGITASTGGSSSVNATAIGGFEQRVGIGFHFAQATEATSPATTGTYYGDVGQPALYQFGIRVRVRG